MENQSKSKIDIYEMVTNRIIQQLESGVIPWRQPWTDAGIPQNLITGNAYKGVNLLLLASMGFTRNYFLTFKQLITLGGSVKKGEKAIPVVFWKRLENKEPSTEIKVCYLLRYYPVFNVDQCHGIPEEKIPMIVNEAEIQIGELDAIINDMPNAPRIQQETLEAYYNPVQDYINMPKMGSFKDAEGYYGVLFHELIHSTGHASRLNRKEVTESNTFGSEPYSMEELVAEIGACYLKSHAGIDDNHFENNVSYIQDWLDVLKNDKKLIVFAAAKAQKAVDYILNVVPVEKEVAENQV